MGLWGFLTNSSYRNGWNAADEFLDLTDGDVTDEQAEAQWDVVESGHSEDYVNGFADNINEPARGVPVSIWKSLFG